MKHETDFITNFPKHKQQIIMAHPYVETPLLLMIALHLTVCVFSKHSSVK